PCLDSASLNSVAGKVPIRRPLESVAHAEGKSTCPAAQAGDLPASNNGVKRSAHVPAERATPPKRQIDDPVRCNLVCGIEIRETSELERAPCVLHLGSGTVDCANSFRVRCEIDGLGERVAKVELNSMRPPTLQICLHGVVARCSHRPPHIQRRVLR